MSAPTTFGALAPGDRFRLLPAGEVWSKVDGLARDYAGPMVDYRETGYAIADDRPVYPLTDAEYLEHLRGEIRAERISWGELADLQGMAELIDPDDVELLEWAGVPEQPDERAAFFAERARETAPAGTLWEHPDLGDWQAEAGRGDTLRGFADWLAWRAECAADERGDQPERQGRPDGHRDRGRRARAAGGP